MARGRTPGRKERILKIAAELGAARFTRAELEEIRRRLIATLGPEASRVSVETVAGILEQAGLAVVWTERADTGGRHEEDFRGVLRFGTLAEAERTLLRLEALRLRFEAVGDRAAAERARELARTGRRRAEMIARNRRVAPRKRAEKEEVARWFGLWLEQPTTFFDWLDLRKQAPEFVREFPTEKSE